MFSRHLSSSRGVSKHVNYIPWSPYYSCHEVRHLIQGVYHLLPLSHETILCHLYSKRFETLVSIYVVNFGTNTCQRSLGRWTIAKEHSTEFHCVRLSITRRWSIDKIPWACPTHKPTNKMTTFWLIYKRSKSEQFNWKAERFGTISLKAEQFIPQLKFRGHLIYKRSKSDQLDWKPEQCNPQLRIEI